MLTQFLLDDVSQCNVAEVLCKPGAAPAFPVSISLTTALGSRVKGKRNRLRFLGAYGHRLVLQPVALLPRFNRVLARRQARQGKSPIFTCHRIIRMPKHK